MRIFITHKHAVLGVCLFVEGEGSRSRVGLRVTFFSLVMHVFFYMKESVLLETKPLKASHS